MDTMYEMDARRINCEIRFLRQAFPGFAPHDERLSHGNRLEALEV